MKSLPSRRSASRKRQKRKEKRLLEEDERFQCKKEGLRNCKDGDKPEGFSPFFFGL